MNSTNFTEFALPFNNNEVALSAFFIFTFFIIGLIGNSVTIAVIVSYTTLLNNIFLNIILSLCFSDLISTLISWLFLYRRTWGFNRWELPDFLCKFYWSVDFLTSFVTASHILTFAIFRLISIVAPKFFSNIRLFHARLCIGLLWSICFVFGLIPSMFIFGPGVPNRTSNAPISRWPACTILEDWIDVYQVYAKVSFSIFLYIPLLGVVATSLVIVWIVYSRSKLPINAKKRNRKKEKQAVLQLLLIIASFLIGYIPFSAYELWSLNEYPNNPYYHRFDYWFGMSEYLFLRFSECLNPFFYNFGSRKVRKHTIMLIKEKLTICKSKRKASITDTSKIKSDPTMGLRFTNDS